MNRDEFRLSLKSIMDLGSSIEAFAQEHHGVVIKVDVEDTALYSKHPDMTPIGCEYRLSGYPGVYARLYIFEECSSANYSTVRLFCVNSEAESALPHIHGINLGSGGYNSPQSSVFSVYLPLANFPHLEARYMEFLRVAAHRAIWTRRDERVQQERSNAISTSLSKNIALSELYKERERIDRAIVKIEWDTQMRIYEEYRGRCGVPCYDGPRYLRLRDSLAAFYPEHYAEAVHRLESSVLSELKGENGDE